MRKDKVARGVVNENKASKGKDLWDPLWAVRDRQKRIDALQQLHETHERNGCDTPAVYRKDSGTYGCFNCEVWWPAEVKK